MSATETGKILETHTAQSSYCSGSQLVLCQLSCYKGTVVHMGIMPCYGSRGRFIAARRRYEGALEGRSSKKRNC